MKKKLIAATILVATATSSFAWGDREQGALLGLIAGAIIVQPQQQYQPPPPVYYQQQPQIILPPVYVQPQPRVCLRHPMYDTRGVLIAYEVSCH